MLVNLHFNCNKIKPHYLISWLEILWKCAVFAVFPKIRQKLCVARTFPRNFQSRKLMKLQYFMQCVDSTAKHLDGKSIANKTIKDNIINSEIFTGSLY